MGAEGKGLPQSARPQGFAEMKRTPLKRKSSLKNNAPFRSAARSSLKASKPMRRVSQRRAKENKTYSIVRKEYLTVNPKCEVCNHAPACDIHHRRGRWKSRLTDATFFLAVCRTCHDRIHHNPEWAYAAGLLLPR